MIYFSINSANGFSYKKSGLLKNYLKSFPAGIDAYDKDFKILGSSSVSLHSPDLIKEDIIGSDFLSRVHQVDKVRVTELLDLFSNSDLQDIQFDFECILENDKPKSYKINFKKIEVTSSMSIEEGVYYTSVSLPNDKSSSRVIEDLYKDKLDEFSIVVETDISGKIINVNDHKCTVSQYSREELIGQNPRMLSSGIHTKEFWKNFWSTISSGQPWRGDICNRAKDGSLYWLDTFVSGVYDEGNKLKGYVAIRIDVTSKVNLELDLVIADERTIASAKLAAIGEMSANIVHEINNPLSIISISNAVLLQKINKNDFSGALKVQQTIASSIERIDKIIKGLKKVSHKNEIGDFASFSLEYVLKETLDLCSELLKGKFIELKVEDFPDIKINCRPIELTQVFINLINNARDAIVSKDERWIEVGFRVDNKEKNLFIDVSDSGEGIPLDVQDKIMETFFTTKAVGVGTGLGLSLSKRIIEEHGGSISLDKKKDHTCFTICLPFI